MNIVQQQRPWVVSISALCDLYNPARLDFNNRMMHEKRVLCCCCCRLLYFYRTVNPFILSIPLTPLESSTHHRHLSPLLGMTLSPNPPYVSPGPFLMHAAQGTKADRHKSEPG